MPNLADVTAAVFKARFPNFKDKDDAYVNAVLGDARGEVNDTWIEQDRVRALLFYTAYQIASEASASATVSLGNGLNVGLSGPLQEVWIGDVKARLSDVKSSGGSGSGGGSAISPTAALYWGEYEKLRRRSFPAVMVV